MIGKRLFIVAVIAGILMIQLAPAFARTSSTTGTTGTTETDDDDTTAVTPMLDPLCLTNFIIQAIFDLITQILASLGSCLPCDAGAGPCIACFAATAPVPPTIPDCTITPTVAPA